ncbi:BMP family ABC transporter substrate-binding protein [Oceanobacillus sp. 143]|uniref:BMP family ABC transporter substrate-binding protein n=1 Tax=Oceanobacillus zhaokaii TaxID=2052660 RepID=A0A345PGK7_9BACI|nr:BMP family protein [Oceanobacillus zhaokaii]AXI09137.1 BMP family ABC transporter substrate-binding protein [Oceanobacillus zhaokaii]QGS68681.1 BMP family ABC transporter substrate-binding protein [Oceanobacillus sp. 143]
MKNSKIALLFALILGLGIFLAACGSSSSDKDTETKENTSGSEGEVTDFSIAMVTDQGGVDDKSFNQSAWEGLQEFGEENGLTKGNGIDFAQSNGQADFMPNITRLVRDEYDVILATGFLLKEDIQKAALQFPDSNFAIVDETVDAPNAASLGFAEHQGSFLVGVAAALKSETGKLGFVGGIDSPLIQKFEAGFTAGAKSVNPDILVDVQYAEHFSDAAKGKLIASNMYDNGIDVIYHAAGGTGNGVFNQAKDIKQNDPERQVWVIGVDRDQHEEGQIGEHNVTLTSMVKRVDVAVKEIANLGKNGEFPGGEKLEFGIEEDGIAVTTTNEEAMTEDIIKAVDEWQEKILNGEVEVPTNREELKAFEESL